MKNNSLFYGMIALIMMFVMTSCEKETLSTDTTEDDITTVETIVEDLDNEVYRFAGELKDFDDCVIVTMEYPEGTFPNSITLDYGTGCTGENGRTRAGQVVISITAPVDEVGAVVSTSFVGFSINGIAMDGSKTITNNGLDDNGHQVYAKVSDLFFTFADGSEMEWHTNRTRTQFKGGDTPTIWDDKFLIEGGAYGTNRNGVDFTITITQGLIKERNCPWISAGILEFSNPNATRYLNFGDGTCNNKAIASNDQGYYRVVTLHAGM